MLYRLSPDLHHWGCEVNAFFINRMINWVNISILMRINCIWKLRLLLSTHVSITSSSCSIRILRLLNIHASITYTSSASSYTCPLPLICSLTYLRLDLYNNHILSRINLFFPPLFANLWLTWSIPNINTYFTHITFVFHFSIDLLELNDSVKRHAILKLV